MRPQTKSRNVGSIAHLMAPLLVRITCPGYEGGLIQVEVSYQLRYVERNRRKSGDPWSLRQTGVHHRYSAQNGLSPPENLWILFHPMLKSVAYKRLQEATEADLRGSGARADPLRLHLLVFSSYVDNWRLYLHDMTRRFLELVCFLSYYRTK
jgi:hypothetical protein